MVKPEHDAQYRGVRARATNPQVFASVASVLASGCAFVAGFQPPPEDDPASLEADFRAKTSGDVKAAEEWQAQVHRQEQDAKRKAAEELKAAGYEGATAADLCCRVCYGGKACGDSCIALDEECSRPSGCACDDR